MAYSQGAIVIADDPLGNNPKRPYQILSNDQVPFHGQEDVDGSDHGNGSNCGR